MRRVSTASTALTFLALAACQQEQAPPEGAQRIILDDVERARIEPPMDSPETDNAAWSVDESGQAIRFGNEGEDPMMSLACRLDEEPPQIAIIRHAPARPGQKALFPVIGNGMRSRFLVDAALRNGEWRWEGILPADDPQLEVFTGPRDLTATLPGRGMLEIAGSRIPGEFLEWCQAGGRVMEVAEEEQEEAEAEPSAGD